MYKQTFMNMKWRAGWDTESYEKLINGIVEDFHEFKLTEQQMYVSSANILFMDQSLLSFIQYERHPKLFYQNFMEEISEAYNQKYNASVNLNNLSLFSLITSETKA